MTLFLGLVKNQKYFAVVDMYMSVNRYLVKKNKSAKYRAEDIAKCCSLCQRERKADFL